MVKLAVAQKDRTFNGHTWQFDYQWYADIEASFTFGMQNKIITYDEILQIKRHICKLGYYKQLSGGGEVYQAKKRIDRKGQVAIIEFLEQMLIRKTRNAPSSP